MKGEWKGRQGNIPACTKEDYPPSPLWCSILTSLEDPEVNLVSKGCKAWSVIVCDVLEHIPKCSEGAQYKLDNTHLDSSNRGASYHATLESIRQ